MSLASERYVVGWTAPMAWWWWAGLFAGCAVLWPWAVLMWALEKAGMVQR